MPLCPDNVSRLRQTWRYSWRYPGKLANIRWYREKRSYTIREAVSLESFISRPDDYSLKLFPMKLYGGSQNIFLNTALSFSPRWLRFFSLLPFAKRGGSLCFYLWFIKINKHPQDYQDAGMRHGFAKENVYSYVCMYLYSVSSNYRYIADTARTSFEIARQGICLSCLVDFNRFACGQSNLP